MRRYIREINWVNAAAVALAVAGTVAAIFGAPLGVVVGLVGIGVVLALL